MNEDIVLAAERLSAIVCQKTFFFFKVGFFYLFRESLLSMHAIFHQHPGTWPAFSSWWFSVWCCRNCTLSPFLPGCLQPVSGISVLFKAPCLLVVFVLLWFLLGGFFSFFYQLLTKQLSLKALCEGQNILSLILITNPISCFPECIPFTHIHSLLTVALFLYRFQPFRLKSKDIEPK